MPGFRVGKPRFRAQLAADAVLAAGQQPIVFDTIVVDDESCWDGAGGYVVERGGLYVVSGRANLGTATSSVPGQLLVTVNGATVDATRSPAGTGFVTLAMTTIIEVDTADVISIEAFRHAVNASTITGGFTGASIVRLGPVRWT